MNIEPISVDVAKETVWAKMAKVECSVYVLGGGRGVVSLDDDDNDGDDDDDGDDNGDADERS